MGINNKIKNVSGIVTVEIEGFFTERFINLCTINNVKIWDVRNIVKGVIRFKINISEFKKLRKIARKTKCKVKIKQKKGIYFTFFKYRKRKIIVVLLFILFFSSISLSTFIWNINVTGNTSIETKSIISKLRETGVYVGKNKIGFDSKKIVNDLRLNMPELSWVGIEINGTTLNVRIAEKTKLEEKYIQNIIPGDIVSNKAGIITKIVPENGTAKFKVGSYIEKDTVAIEGYIYSKFLEPKKVPAKGILMIESKYELKKEYKYQNIVKEYTRKKRYTIGISINSKENIINYLNKSKKYDINKSSKKINIFGNEISFDFYSFDEYIEKIELKTREELLIESEKNIEKYLNEDILSNSKNATCNKKNTVIEDREDGIICTTIYNINEEVGIFIERK